MDPRSISPSLVVMTVGTPVVFHDESDVDPGDAIFVLALSQLNVIVSCLFTTCSWCNNQLVSGHLVSLNYRTTILSKQDYCAITIVLSQKYIQREHGMHEMNAK